MSSKENIIEFIGHTLKNKDIYNYVLYLRKFDNKEQDEKVSKYINTLELFAFGDYQHFLSYQEHYISLDSVLLIKLIRLTILSATAQEGKIIKIDQLLVKYKLQNAIEHYIKVTRKSMPTDLILEKICIDMIDDSVIEIKFNDIENTLVTGKTNVIRDSFDNNTVSLRVLKQKDIVGKDLSNALIHLQGWFEHNLKPTKADLDSQINIIEQTKDKNSRKRKPSDNSSV